jgi:hypothetical protein
VTAASARSVRRVVAVQQGPHVGVLQQRHQGPPRILADPGVITAVTSFLTVTDGHLDAAA